MDITVTEDGIELASGELDIDTSMFTPDGGREVPANLTSWSSSPNGPANWNFQVSGSANGGFPLGKNGTPFTYSFTGNQNARGTNPSGRVTWPAGIEAGDNTTWQGEATEGGDEDEEYSRTQSAG